MGTPSKIVTIDGYQHINTVVNTAVDMMDKVRSGNLKPLFTSLNKETEKIGGYYPSDQIVIAGRTGTGKSAKAAHDIFDFTNTVLNPFYEGKILILWDSYEMAAWRNILRAISREGGIEAKALLDYHKRLTEERYAALRMVAEKFKGLPVYISTRPLSAKQWVERKKEIQGQFPQHFIINLFDHTRLGKKSDEGKEEELIHNFMVGGIELKNNFNMFNFFLSQMNRNIETAINRDKLGTHLPVSSDIFGSDSVFQCADIVLALHRPGMYGLTEFDGIPTGIIPDRPEISDNLLIERVLKQRDGWTGNLLLKHNLALNQFSDYEVVETIINKPSKEDEDF